MFGNLFGSGKPDPVPTHVPAPDQARELLLYKFDACPYCARVARVVDELGLEVPTRDTVQDRDARPELQRLTGRMMVPCLFIDGEALFESRDIVAWLRAYKTATA